MKFQGRGNVYLTELDAALALTRNTIKLCTDTLLVTLNVETFSHKNRCGAVDVTDATGIKDQNATVQMTFTDVEDKKFAFAVLGTENEDDVGTSAVVGEELPEDIAAGDYYFLGGKTRHRNITALTIAGGGSPNSGTMVEGTHYTLDADSGLVTFIDVAGMSQPLVANYTHQDPETVSILTGGQKEWALNFEFMNRQQANAEGGLELYRTKFNPAQNMDFMSDELQIMDMRGESLADTSRDASDTELGQFGRRVLTNVI